jgi:hypothetical protein
MSTGHCAMSSLRRSARRRGCGCGGRCTRGVALNPMRRLPRHPLLARQPVSWRARRRHSTSSRRQHWQGGVCRHLVQLMQQAKATRPSQNAKTGAVFEGICY